jgi:hypothetical protein
MDVAVENAALVEALVGGEDGAAEPQQAGPPPRIGRIPDTAPPQLGRGDVAVDAGEPLDGEVAAALDHAVLEQPRRTLAVEQGEHRGLALEGAAGLAGRGGAFDLQRG